MPTTSRTNVFKVNECVELMNAIKQFSNILDTQSDKMEEGVFLSLYDTLKLLYDTELCFKISEYAGRKGRKYSGRTKHTQQQYRILAEQYPDKYAVCPICETGMLKENVKLHYQTTQKCRDIYYTKRGVDLCKECIDPKIKDLISEIYGEPVPPLSQELLDASNNSPNYNFNTAGQ